MATIAYQASHEQFAPSDLLRYVQLAAQAGFGAINSSDHFYPWSERQGHSGYAFAWLGAAMQMAPLPFSSVCAPGWRYNPAIVAQAIATLGEMFPGRYTVALGSGEALNERIAGMGWPAKEERNARLTECADIIRQLLEGDTVSHKGRVVVENAKLYTLPKERPLLFGAAITKETAALVGSWADGLLTVQNKLEELAEIIDRFERGGGKGKPRHIKLQLSYDKDWEVAMNGAIDQWRNNILPSSVLGDVAAVTQFDELGKYVKAEDVVEKVMISSNHEAFIKWIQQFIDLGFERIILHNVNRNQENFITDFGKHVLPYLR